LLLTLVNFALICSLGMGLTMTRGDGWVMILGMLLVDAVCVALWLAYVQPWISGLN